MWLEAGAAAALAAWAVRGRSSSVFAHSVYKGVTGRRSVALTFDDGPSESTVRLLDILDRFQARATFFQIGQQAARLPEIARQVSLRGHEIGNHTYTHAIALLPGLEREIALCQTALASIHGAPPRLFRAPYGVRWFGLRNAQRRHGLLGVMWTAIGLDWKLPSEKVVSRLMSDVAPGSILCLHDGRELSVRPDVTVTLKSAEEVLRRLRDSGYQFETVSEILCPMNSRSE
jgi:peptidoglycan/xylan/chitin deacetylase (PgdA/CDA1 family)